MLAAACAVDPTAAPPPRALRWVLSAGAPLADALCRRAEARLGCEVRQGYGLTEASFSTIDAPPAPRTLGSVGRPVAGVEVRLRVGGEADGEVEVRGPHRMLGYLDDAAATAAVVDGDGWLRTGDVGRLDGDGRLCDRRPHQGPHHSRRQQRLPVGGRGRAGRASRRRRRGRRRAPRRLLRRGGRRRRRPRAGCSVGADELAEFARARIAATKVPREFAFVDALPLGPSGKVQKRDLRARLADGTLPTTKASR